MSSKIILISGSTDGIGKQTALMIAGEGHRVIIHGRNRQRCRETVREIRSLTANEAVEMICGDLSSLADIHRMSEELHQKYERLDVLINNAGVFEKKRRLTADGLEMTFAVNHLAVFLLTGLTLDLLKHSVPSRIVVVSSMAHAASIDFNNLQGEQGYSGYAAYSLSKLANILFTFELARRLNKNEITVNCLHPGVIRTKLLQAGWGNGGASTAEGAKTSVYLALSPQVEGVSGKYFSGLSESRPAGIAYNEEVGKKLWRISEELCRFQYEI